MVAGEVLVLVLDAADVGELEPVALELAGPLAAAVDLADAGQPQTEGRVLQVRQGQAGEGEGDLLEVALVAADARLAELQPDVVDGGEDVARRVAGRADVVVALDEIEIEQGRGPAERPALPARDAEVRNHILWLSGKLM